MSSQKPGERSVLPVWFFIGVLLTVYGVLLLCAGIYQFSHPPHTALAKYHATFWGGLVILTIGIIYLALFWPCPQGKKRSRE